MASARIMRQFAAMGGRAAVRMAGDKPLVKKATHRLWSAHKAHIEEHLVPEARIEKMEHCMLATAHIEVHSARMTGCGVI